MKNPLLLPYSFKWIGLALSGCFFALCVAAYGYDFSFSFLAWHAPQNGLTAGNNNLTDEVALCGLVCSLLLIIFAREKREDEYVNALRLQSFQLAFIIHYVMLMIIIFTTYGFSFLLIMVETIPAMLLLFLVIFYFRLKAMPFFTKRRPI